jgi:hypothetical protein
VKEFIICTSFYGPPLMHTYWTPWNCRPVCLGVKHPSGAQDQIFITVRQLQVFLCGAPSLRRGRVCLSQLLLASLAQSCLPPMNSNGHFASWVLISFLSWSLLCLLVSRPLWALSWSAEISSRLLRTCRSETNCCTRSLIWLTWYLLLVVPQGKRALISPTRAAQAWPAEDGWGCCYCCVPA